MMKKGLVILILSVICLDLSSQLVNNKIRIYIGGTSGRYYGQSTTNENGYISLTLFAGYKNLSGANIKVLFKMTEIFSVGPAVDYSVASDWGSQTSYFYYLSRSDNYVLSAILKLHSKYHDSGFTNRFTFSLEMAPEVGLSGLKLGQPIFTVVGPIPESSQNRKYDVKDLVFGIRSGIGVEYSLIQLGGLFINYSFHYDRVNSKFYNDKQILSSCVNFGVFARFGYDKLFLYR
jgi:hypothetical protein